MAAYERQVRASEREAELWHWANLNEQMLALGFVHKQEFEPRQRPEAPNPDPVDGRSISARHRREQLAGVPVWRRRDRKAAKQRAEELAASEIAGEEQLRTDEQAARQRELDEWWRRLVANDREVVFESIEAAFEDNEMPAAPIDVQGAGAALVMKVGGPADLIPERELTTTPTGKPTHKRRTKGVINRLYAELLASNGVATVREAFAVAPGLDTVRLLVIRGDRLGGRQQLIPLYVGEFARGDVKGVSWADVNVLDFIERRGDIRYKGQAQDLAPLDTKSDPGLRATLDELAAHLDWKAAP